MKKTSLHEIHKSFGAKMVPFAGWEMPVQYTGIIQEHTNVRLECGLFDVSHMGEVLVKGDQAQTWLNTMLTNNISKVLPNQAQYNLMLYPNGTVVDDVIIYKISESEIFICLNASNCEKDIQWLTQHAPKDLQVLDLSDQYSQIALQGPNSFALLDQTSWGKKLKTNLKTFYFCDLPYQGSTIRVARTGYTGEDGVEIFVPNQLAPALWCELMEVGQRHGLQPIGLGARDSLRLEAGLPLYGHEISDTINPLEADLGWAVKLEKENFMGRESLLNWQQQSAPPKRKLVGLYTQDRRIARQEHLVFAEESMQTPIGVIASGTFAPTLGKPIATALLTQHNLPIVFVRIRDQAVPFELTSKRFVSKKK